MKFCFKNEDRNNLDIEKSVTVIQLVELHMIGLNSVIMAKDLYEEFVGSSDLAFQNNLLNYNYVTKVAEKIPPNSLCYELANDVSDNHQQQISWIITQLELIKSRSEKARFIGFDKKESQPDMMRTTLNFIEKKVKPTELNYQHKKEKLENYKRRKKEKEEKIQMKKKKQEKICEQKKLKKEDITTPKKDDIINNESRISNCLKTQTDVVNHQNHKSSQT